MKNLLEALGLAIAALALAGLLLMAAVYAAQAHEDHGFHYPQNCCHDRDCAPAEKVEQVPTRTLVRAGLVYQEQTRLPSQLVITTKHGTVVVPETFQRKPSPDGRWHACIQNNGGISPPTLICVFEPPAM